MFHVIVKVNSILQHEIQIKNRIMTNASVCVKSIPRAKRIIFGILAHVFMKIVSL